MDWKYMKLTQRLATCCFCLALPNFASTNQDNISQIEIVPAFPNLSFSNPVFLTHGGDGDNRIFVVEQPGRIRVFPNDPQVGNASVFLNIEARVNDSGGEMGLLGLAFHPNFANNGFFYVNYTTGSGSQRRTVISRFSTSASNSNLGDQNSELILIEFSQPFTNHNAGMVAFGPDGFFYIATGDGGGGGDPFDNGQDRTNFLGKILRIDVDNPQGELNYGIPSDNPFAGNLKNFREEIWAYGLRNPWRFSFDFPTAQLWAGDVGQGRLEEVDLIEKGGNYGWRIMEGSDCFNPANCNPGGLAQPIVEYNHNFGCSITGGYVYRGSFRPELTGAYIYGDFCSGRIWLLRYENEQVVADTLLIDTSLSISSFGVDENSELYALHYSNGTIHRFTESPTRIDDDPSASVPEDYLLEQNYPNPFNPNTNIKYSLPALTKVQVIIFNTLGNRIKLLLETRQGPGRFQVTWDGTNDEGDTVATGVYYYQIQTESFVQTRKMLLIR